MADRLKFRMDPMGLGALVGGIVTFVVVGAIVQTFFVVIGTLVGAGVGWLVRRFARQAVVYEEAVDLRETTTKTELYRQATELGIEGRSSMSKDELVAAITERRSTAA